MGYWNYFSTLFYIIYGIKHNKYSFIKTLLLSIFVLLVEILGAKILYIFENFNDILINGVSFARFSLLGIFFSIPLFTFIISKLFKLIFLELLDYFMKFKVLNLLSWDGLVGNNKEKTGKVN
ncbi:MAG: hypothetical protein IAA85_03575 [Firmicutes bacterium]|nr:hypothetical protein [Candidatus Alectryobacillus merdavium]